MAASFTFGSLGDILTLCQIGMALGKAVSNSQGSAAAYRALKTNIDSFVQILMQVIAVLQEREHAGWMPELEKIIGQTVDSCADDMREALAHFRARYERTLGDVDDKSANVLWTGIKKIEFRIRESERLENLQDNLAVSTSQLTLLVQLHARKAAKVSDALMAERMDQVAGLLMKQSNDIEEQMLIHREQARDLMSELCAMGDSIKLQEANSSRIVSTLRSNTQSLQQLTLRVTDIFSLLAEDRNCQTRHRYFAGPNPTFGKPIIFEDALGQLLEIPLPWIRSWKHFETNIQHLFEDRRGHSKVLNGEYTLEEEVTGTELNRSLPWTAVLRAGMKINMSMIFRLERSQDDTGWSSCPGCGTHGEGKFGSNIQCSMSSCGKWFKIISSHGPPEREGLEENYISRPGSETSDAVSAETAADFNRVRLELITITLQSTTVTPEDNALSARERMYKSFKESMTPQHLEALHRAENNYMKEEFERHRKELVARLGDPNQQSPDYYEAVISWR